MLGQVIGVMNAEPAALPVAAGDGRSRSRSSSRYVFFDRAWNPPMWVGSGWRRVWVSGWRRVFGHFRSKRNARRAVSNYFYSMALAAGCEIMEVKRTIAFKRKRDRDPGPQARDLRTRTARTLPEWRREMADRVAMEWRWRGFDD